MIRRPATPGRTLLAATGALTSLSLVALLHEAIYGDTGLQIIIAAFGASAVVLHGAPDSRLARARNVFGGSLIASFIGVSLATFWPDAPGWMLVLAAVPLAIAAMDLSDTMHPPAGAMAFLAVAGPPEIRDLGYLYLLYPIGSGTLVMFATARAFRRLGRAVAVSSPGAER